MKRYKRKSKLMEYFKPVLTFKGHTIYDVEHSVERYHERVGKDLFLYEKLLKKGILHLIKNGLNNSEDRYIFVSKRYGFGIQVHWRLGRYADEGYGGYSATTLSNDEMKHLLKDDKKLFLEHFQNRGHTESESEDIFQKGYGRYEFEGELKEELDLISLDVFAEVGEIFRTYEIINI